MKELGEYLKQTRLSNGVSIKRILKVGMLKLSKMYMS